MGHAFPPFYVNETTGCDAVEGLDGSGLMDAAGPHVIEEHSLVEVSSAPVSGPEAHNIEYPAGKVGESSQLKIWAWKTPSGDPCDILRQSEHEYREVYIREIRKIWTDRADGTVETFGSGGGFKFGHLGGHGPKEDGENKGYSWTLGVVIDRSLDFQAEFQLKARMLWTDLEGDRRTNSYGQNVDDRMKVVVGRWHEVEWQTIANTIAADGSANADGVIRAWIDGVLVMEHTNVKMRSGVADHTREYWQYYDQTTTWSGGPDSEHTHDKGFHVDHVYVSGGGSLR